MNTYTFELRTMKPWPWLIGIAGVIVSVMSMYPMVAKDSEDFLRVIDGLPDAFKAVFQMNGLFDTGVLGFFGFTLNYIKMIAGVQAMLWGAAVMTKERRFHTAEFILSKPRERYQILTAKICAVATHLALTSIVFLLMSAAMLAVFADEYSVGNFTLIFIGFIGFQLVFFSAGLFAGTAFQKLKNPLGVTLAVVFGTYIAGALSGLSDDSKLKLLSPFEYFSASAILANGHLSTGYTALALIVSALFIAGSYYTLQRQDIR